MLIAIREHLRTFLLQQSFTQSHHPVSSHKIVKYLVKAFITAIPYHQISPGVIQASFYVAYVDLLCVLLPRSYGHSVSTWSQ